MRAYGDSLSSNGPSFVKASSRNWGYALMTDLNLASDDGTASGTVPVNSEFREVHTACGASRPTGFTGADQGTLQPAEPPASWLALPSPGVPGRPEPTGAFGARQRLHTLSQPENGQGAAG